MSTLIYLQSYWGKAVHMKGGQSYPVIPATAACNIHSADAMCQNLSTLAIILLCASTCAQYTCIRSITIPKASISERTVYMYMYVSMNMYFYMYMYVLSTKKSKAFKEV